MTMETTTIQGSPTADQAVPAPDGPITPVVGDAITTSDTSQSQVPAQQEYNWDDDRNPYKYAHQQLSVELERREAARLQYQAVQRVQSLEAEGMTPEQAAATMQNELAAYKLQQMQEKLNDQARGPVAHMLAERIAKEYNVSITAKELLSTSSGQEIKSVDAMLARADAIVSERRKTNFDKRVKDGADKVDGKGPNTTTVDPTRYRKMSPAQIIAEGIRQSK